MDDRDDQAVCAGSVAHGLDGHAEGSVLCAWQTFQGRLQLHVQEQYIACEQLAKDLIDSICELPSATSKPLLPRENLDDLDAAQVQCARASTTTCCASNGGPVCSVACELKSECRDLTDEGSKTSRCRDDASCSGSPIGELQTPPPSPPSRPPRLGRRGTGIRPASTENFAHLDKLGAAFVTTTLMHGFSTDFSVKPKFLRRFEHFVKEIAQPDHDSFLARLQHSKAFELLCASVIVINTVFIIQTTNRDIQTVATAADSGVASMYGGFSLIELLFFIFYSSELLLRLWVHKFHFFFNDEFTWNILDFVLVATSFFEIVLSVALGGSFNKMFLRVLRLLKVTKLIRVFRAVRFLQEMRQFFGCLRSCAMSLFWAIVMIGLVLLVFSLFFVQGITSHLQDLAGPSQDASMGAILEEFGVSKSDMLDNFGSVYQAMITLLEIGCGHGEWHEKFIIARASGRVNGALFVFFTLFFTVAVWNIVTSIFLENTMKMAQPDRESELLEKHRRDVNDAKELLSILEMADVDCSGMLSREEFREFLHDDKFRGYFDMRGIDVKDAEVFFEMISTSTASSEVDLEAFVGSCLRVKGTATSIDLHTLSFENKMMHQVQKRFNAALSEDLKSLDEKLTMLGLNVCRGEALDTQIGWQREASGHNGSLPDVPHSDACAEPSDVPAQTIETDPCAGVQHGRVEDDACVNVQHQRLLL
eukprot:TRINITY_DN5104_c0_g1_i2.p1 TRINITY_DN5104_c0_g1~~TRINITY_DN5104_c0_g1_i2.p1  ORF type:complete len:704 (+),score=127.31 TRINITY_DN5104_c0_g1_i2:60-2171(+)